MEGYALAKVCKKQGVRLISVKYISDGANDTAHLDWEDNLLLGAQKLLALFESIWGFDSVFFNSATIECYGRMPKLLSFE